MRRSATWLGSGSDADVLVRPSHIPLLLEQLERHGWQHYSDFESGSPFGHAATFFHDCWGFGDIHRHFPGIGLAADEAFEQLWAARTTRPLAGVPCARPVTRGSGTHHGAQRRSLWWSVEPDGAGANRMGGDAARAARAGDRPRREPARGGCLQRRAGRAGAVQGTPRVPPLEGHLTGGHPAGGMGRPRVGGAHASSTRSGWQRARLWSTPSTSPTGSAVNRLDSRCCASSWRARSAA